MQKILVSLGIVLVVVGVLWPWLSKLPFGRLPGDIIIDKPNLKLYVPITTMLVISGLVSLVLWFFRK